MCLCEKGRSTVRVKVFARSTNISCVEPFTSHTELRKATDKEERFKEDQTTKRMVLKNTRNASEQQYPCSPGEKKENTNTHQQLYRGIFSYYWSDRRACCYHCTTSVQEGVSPGTTTSIVIIINRVATIGNTLL